MSIKRQDIVDAIGARLKTIATGSGYHSNLGANVFTWRRAPYEAHELPAANILDRDVKLAATGLKGSTSLSTYEMALEVHVVTTGEDSDTTVRQLAADVYKAFGTDDTFGGKAIITTPTGDEMYAEHRGEIVADAVLRFAILYRTNLYQET